MAKPSKAQIRVLQEMGDRRNALVNGDKNHGPQWWVEGGMGVHRAVARALIRHSLVELTGREGGHPGILLFTATERGREVARG